MGKDPKFDQLAESLIFRPWPKGDPVLSLILDQMQEAERGQILTSAVQSYRESLAAEMKFVDTVMKVLSKTKAP
jgi:hypothetical protein